MYAGVDAHKRTSQVTVIDESGKVVKRATGGEHAGGRPTSLGVLQWSNEGGGRSELLLRADA